MGSSPRYTRGTSIIAALVFAALLGAVALSLNALQSGSANTAALPAAGAQTQAPATTQTTPAQAQQATCNQAIQQLISSGITESKTTITPYPSTDKSQIKDNCTDAMLKQGATDPKNPSSYSCIGKTVKIVLTQNGQGLSVVASPNSTQPAGQCKTLSCSSATNAQTCTPDSTSYPGLGNSSGNGSNTQTPTVTTDKPLPGSCSKSSTSGTISCVTDANTANQIASQVPQGYTCTSAIQSVSDNTVSTTCNPPSAVTPPQPCQPGATSCNTCTGGQTWNGTTCAAPAAVPPPQTCPAGMTCTQTPPPGGGSNPLGSLSSLLSGLAKGLTGSNCGQSSSVGGNGTTYTQQQVQQSNGTYVTVLVPQQTGTTATGQPCIPAQSQPQSQQQAPYGTGTDGSACPAPPTAPQCATGATAQPISATGNGCMTGYQCVPTSSTIGQTPTPQISCSPQIADVGQSVAISYSCQNATGSSGGGFSTNNQTSGSANVTIVAPPSGTNTANYGITCTGSGQTANAQCSVQVNQPAIDLVADPQAVPAGQTTSIGWVTAGMQSCVISSPQDAGFTQANASNTSANGVAQSDAITTSTEFDLTCQTLGGQTKKASTTVTVGSAASSSASVNVSSTADGATVNHGDTVTITWDASTTPQDSAIALWLIDINTEQATALIAGDQSASGTYAWQLPAAGSTCDQSSLAPCASNLVDGDSYGIEAAVYTPQDAYLGLTVPSGDTAPTYVDYGYTATPFTVGQ